MGDKIVFQLGARTFGIDIDAVYKILEVDRVFFIPGQSGIVSGMVSLMGAPVAVINCRKALNAAQDAAGAENGNGRGTHKILVVRNRNRMVGLDVNGANLSFVWREKIKGVHAFLGSAQDLSEGRQRFTGGTIEVEDAPSVELIDWEAIFEEAKKTLSTQRDHGG